MAISILENININEDENSNGNLQQSLNEEPLLSAISNIDPSQKLHPVPSSDLNTIVYPINDDIVPLIKNKKLILVVDIDQTIIQATVDPIINDWRQDSSNPNYPVLKDVQAFALEESTSLPNGYETPTICWYYVKLRPGLHNFLEEISNLYQLHIYTMATRAYAKSILKIIDPLGKYFGDRILSRDESGSLTEKNLSKMFSNDVSNVVIIDDRGDVWKWSKNLIKVMPYDFFVGIGDINSSALISDSIETDVSNEIVSGSEVEITNSNDHFDYDEPKENEKEINYTTNDSEQQDATMNDHNQEMKGTNIINSNDESGNETVIIESSNSNLSSSLTNDNESEKSLEELQESLEKEIDERINNDKSSSLPSSELKIEIEIDSNNCKNSNSNDDYQNIYNTHPNLLVDNDNELKSLEIILEKVHYEYFNQLDQLKDSYLTKHENENEIMKNNNNKDDIIEILVKNHQIPIIDDLIPNLKEEIFKNFTFLFSGLLPTEILFESNDLIIWLKTFGAKIISNLNLNLTSTSTSTSTNTNITNNSNINVTHLITYSINNEKIKLILKKFPKIKIIHPDWLFKCISNWERISEDDYLIHPENNNSNFITSSSTQVIETSTPNHVDEFDSDITLGFDWIETNDKDITTFLNNNDPNNENKKEIEIDMEMEMDKENVNINKNEINPIKVFAGQLPSLLSKKRSRVSHNDDHDNNDLDIDESKRVKNIKTWTSVTEDIITRDSEHCMA